MPLPTVLLASSDALKVVLRGVRPSSSRVNSSQSSKRPANGTGITVGGSREVTNTRGVKQGAQEGVADLQSSHEGARAADSTSSRMPPSKQRTQQQEHKQNKQQQQEKEPTSQKGLLAYASGIAVVSVALSCVWLWLRRHDGAAASEPLTEMSWQQFQAKHGKDLRIDTVLQRHYSSRGPLLLRSVPLPTNQTIHALLSGIEYPSLSVHDVASVPFSDSQSAWPTRRPSLLQAETLPFDKVDPHDLVDFPFARGATSSAQPPKSRWWHITLTLPKILAKHLALGLFDSLDERVLTRLWLARPGWTVTPHYDLTDNIFLQLAGTKTFTIASPDAQRFLRPHPALHQSWRQSQRFDLTSPSKLAAARQEAGPNAKAKIWQVTLQRGDVLFMPAYFFHAVLTGSGSVSVNAWLPSEAAAVGASLRQAVPLPWHADDSKEPEEDSLAALGSAFISFAKQAALPSLLDCSPVDLVDMLRSRHRLLAEAGHWCSDDAHSGSSKAGVCTANKQSTNIQLVERTAQTLLQHLAAPSIRHPDVRIILALDWLEETLDAVLGPTSSPCSVLRFADSCLTPR